MDSSDRLDMLVERARVLFESKYGSSKDCFAAFSPAKVNLMGDFVEGSGGLVLQMTLDRRVIFYGRGRALPEYRPAGPGTRGGKGAELKAGHRRFGGGGEGVGDTGSVVKGHGVEGGEAEGLDDGGVLLNPVLRWPGRQGKKAGKAGIMDAMVQDLVFGRKHRSKSMIVAHSDSSATSPASVARTGSPVPSSYRGGSGSGGGENVRKGSWSSTPSTSRHDSSASGHGSSSRLSAQIENHTHSNPISGAPPRPASGAFNVPPIQVQELDSGGVVSREYYGSVESGSTTTEEAFPNDNSMYNSGGSLAAVSAGEKGGENGGLHGGGGGSDARQKTLAVEDDQVSLIPHNTESSVTCKDDRGRPEGIEGLSLEAGLSHDDVHGAESPEFVEVSAHGPAEEIGEFPNEDAFYEARSSEQRPGAGGGVSPSSSLKRPASEPVFKKDIGGGGGGGGGGGSSGVDGGQGPPGFTAAGSAGGASHTEVAASSEEGRLQRLIAAAQEAELEAERLRTCRIYCEACPKDGVVEFTAYRDMRGGGDSWQGLVTAVAAEYMQEVATGEVLGLEAVVVSDLPGGQGQGAAVGASGRQVAQEGAGHGWGEAARSALLMASATFLEEVLEMRRFPRMKAIRCFSAATRCRPLPGQSGEKKRTWSGAAPSSPFACQDVSVSQRWDSVEGSGGSGERGGGGVSTAEEGGGAGGMRVEDLLAIADDDPPGAVLVDSKTRTYWPITMRGPNDEDIAVIIAQPLDLETAQRLKWQAEHERAKGSATCRAVVTVAKERHPEASTLRDVPAETLEALISIGTVRGQGKGTAAAAALASESWWWAGRSGGGGGGGGSTQLSGGVSSPTSMSGVKAVLARRRLTPEVLAHARHLAAEVQRVREVAAAFMVGDMEAVGRLMMQSRRSAGLTITGTRGRAEPAEPAAARLAAMVARLPGVHGSRQSEGRGSGAAGVVVALVEPDYVEGVLRAIATRGATSTGVAWGGFAARPGGGSGIVTIA